MEDPLALAKELIQHGVPCFVAPQPYNPHPRFEFAFPDEWQNIEPSEQHLEGWSRRAAVCAVTGIMFDVLDIDPRNGGGITFQDLKASGMLPTFRGINSTPSGGLHCIIDRTKLYTKTKVWPGIDLKSGNVHGNGRGFIYIPPTVRYSKTDGQLRRYRIVQPIDWAGLGQYDEQFEIFFKHLYSIYKPTLTERYTDQYAKFGAIELNEVQRTIVAKRLRRIHQKLAACKPGDRDNTLYTYARALGGYITGMGVPEEYCVKLLESATNQWNESEQDRIHWIQYKIERSLNIGKSKPLVIFDEHGREIKGSGAGNQRRVNGRSNGSIRPIRVD